MIFIYRHSRAINKKSSGDLKDKKKIRSVAQTNRRINEIDSGPNHEDTRMAYVKAQLISGRSLRKIDIGNLNRRNHDGER